MKLTASVVGLIIGVLSASPPCDADCPTNTILGITSIYAQDSRTDGGVIGGDTAQYDLVAGTLSGSFYSIVDASVSLLSIADNYTIEGLPAGTPVSIVIELDAHASASGKGQYAITLQGPDGVTNFQSGVTDWSGTLHVNEAVIAGQPFQVHFHMGAGTAAIGVLSKVSESATVFFSNLPGGTSVVSCQGFHQDAVPVQAKTWGSVKAFYR